MRIRMIRTILAAAAALVALSAPMAWSEDCVRQVWVTVADVDDFDIHILGPFAHVQQGAYQGNPLRTLAHPAPGPADEAPLITIAEWDAFSNLWSFDYAGVAGSSDTLLITPYDPLGNGIVCVPGKSGARGVRGAQGVKYRVRRER